MARIVIDAREVLGTTGRYIRKLLEYLQQIDTSNEYFVLLHQKGYDNTELSAKNFTKIVVKEKKFSFAEQLFLPKTIKRLKPDLVHFTMPNQPVFFRGKVVTTIHDLIPIRLRNLAGNSFVYRLKSYVFAWVTKRAAKKSVRVITPTQYVKQDVLNFAGISDDKTVVTLEAADVISGGPKPYENLVGKEFIFYVGRAQPHKNLARLIAAFEIVHTSHPELFLALAGKSDPSYERIKALALQSPARENIVFTGFIPDMELKWLYQHARAYVFPSLSEGFGLPPLEAMIHNCPVVSSNATCLPEVNGDAVLYFDPLNVDDMAKKINEVITNDNLRETLIKEGTAQVNKYSWKYMAEQTLAVYVDALRD